MASKGELVKHHPLPADTRFLTEDNMDALFVFGKDERADDIDINHLTKPVLIQYYNEAVRDWE